MNELCSLNQFFVLNIPFPGLVGMKLLKSTTLAPHLVLAHMNLPVWAILMSEIASHKKYLKKEMSEIASHKKIKKKKFIKFLSLYIY